ncbi:hypothetical protein [Algibacter lectus]|uniref:hypothetical protein n=1 Tax=Algibacter lectus TaxID=221126 RepID=UPI000942FC78|nr:hypothetical protein [Algibacter lectus]
MKLRYKIIGIYCGILILLISCKTTKNPLFYNLSEFNLNAGKEFVVEINSLNEITKISVVDVQLERNEFKVNGQSIFNDTLQKNLPNYYSYTKRAKELDIEPDKLSKLLSVFKEIKVSEFIREDGFYNFPVEQYALSKHNGYLYKSSSDLKVGDTLRNERNIYNTFILKKQIAENWFEYESE